jgi:hypothetical protein
VERRHPCPDKSGFTAIRAGYSFLRAGCSRIPTRREQDVGAPVPAPRLPTPFFDTFCDARVISPLP